jgi:hypothetical protein
MSYRVGIAYIPEEGIVEAYGDVAFDVSVKLEHFKRWLERYQDKGRLPIGVCRLEECSKFFVKRRRDQLYCSPKHKVQAFRRGKTKSKAGQRM